MAPLRAPVRLDRPRLLSALASPAPLVALLGPDGAGASTLLRQFAEGRRDVTWAGDGRIPDEVSRTLIIDDGDSLSPGAWERLRQLRATRPDLIVRLAVRSARAVPVAWDVEWVRDLAFTLDETITYVAARGSHLNPRAVQAATGGLPAAVVAVVEANVTDPAAVQLVLARLAPHPLPATSAALAVPEFLTPRLAAQLGGGDDVIERAERTGHGEWRTDDGTLIFALTAPIRAATLAAAPIAAEDQRAIRHRAARALLQEGAGLGAVVEGAAADALDIVDAALRRDGLKLLWGNGARIAAALRPIPLLQLRRWPVIALAQALILNARREHRVRAAELLGVALLGVQTGQSEPADRALLRIIESVARRLTGVGDRGVRAARLAAQTLDELPPDDLEQLRGLRGDLHAHAAISLLYGGDDRAAGDQFEQALATATRPSVELLAYGGLALIQASAGELPAAQSWVEQTLARPWPDDILDEYQGSLLRIAESRLALERGDAAAAEAAVATIWPIIDTIEHWPALGAARAWADISAGRPVEGLERLRSLRSRRGRRMSASSPAARMLDATESMLALAAADLASARRLASRPSDRAEVVLAAARVAVFDRQHERALKLLNAVMTRTPRQRTEAAALEAILLHRLGRVDEARALAGRAGALARTYGLRTPFLILPAAEHDLFQGDVDDLPAPVTIAGVAPQLTTRESIVARHLVDTANMEEIAARLHVSINTVKSQRRSLYRKLGASSREEAIAAALAYGLLAGADPTRAMIAVDDSAASAARTKRTP
ncbi:helix-turn-helix transcriptional regulator [Microbacterium sp. NE2HP2]|uniref:helix-turn-helix domain-containing protein n=1 Tax=Microbacterium plantarum TaxID=1816425 RepID=UPI0023650C2C|nr:helix-turn-helix transcriptional regulator [Microbacterium plantarum]MDD7945638.1 helix-turn-helix transcriptional regulator [Microbacterium plantarum]